MMKGDLEGLGVGGSALGVWWHSEKDADNGCAVPAVPACSVENRYASILQEYSLRTSLFFGTV